MLRDSTDLINKRLGNYSIQRLIQDTRMSAVYYGIELITERAVAVKVLFPDIRSRSREYQKYLIRFQREAIFIANLKHPYIVPILAYSEMEEIPYIVMPFYENGTLGDLLRQRGQIPLHETVQYIENIAPALAYAHSQNITHRDIKPGNFLLDSNKRLILTDFGIARQAGNSNWSTLTTSNKILGTLQYMAPELFHGRKADPRADIYALGIVIYEMLQGTVPFTGTDSFAIIDQHINGQFPSLHLLNPAIPDSVDGVLRKATAKQCEDRYESVTELAAALSHAVESYTLNNAPTEVDLFLKPQTFPSQAQVYPLTVPARPVNMPHVNRKKARSSSGKFVVVLIVTLFVIILATSGFVFAPRLFSPTQPISTPQTALTPSQQAKATVAEYYSDWNKGEYQSAYNLLNPTYQKGQKGYAYSRSNYANVHYSCISFGQIIPRSDSTVQVMLTINQIQVNPAGINVYTGYFIVQQVQGKWRITPFLGQTSTHGSCIEP
ncbi:MAG: serine/threonine-protein kinase [Ktedonobacteraceae bacterium]